MKVGDKVWVAHFGHYDDLCWDLTEDTITSIKIEKVYGGTAKIYYFNNQDFIGHLESGIFISKELAKLALITSILEYKKDIDYQLDYIKNL